MFYGDGATRLRAHVPTCSHAQFNAASDNGVIVMHDLIAARAHFYTALERSPAARVPMPCENAPLRLQTARSLAWCDRPRQY